MRINPQAKTAASYAKLFKEKIEQSRENTTRSNGISENSKQEKPTVKGIKFDELSSGIGRRLPYIVTVYPFSFAFSTVRSRNSLTFP